ncbi:metalloregulator ArsR/SmtB family transcription factor [Bacillus mycoides]|uniref:Transcriptional regulator n=1 Tax=Bacillus thuringiensis serovar navarrensis TaxID=339658 RepID=A0A243AJK9_BACTU|nr:MULTISPECIES: metalloregulator ArsR/SmtB family transcription factor [Bacillus cereus group]KAA0768058.1 ArsR family transcriptional regulator [Bacillus sp. BB51/4]MED1270686.1 metalloregulator ArsR/SmtB family transcription factor [Bacillus mycoides]OTY24665.1 transcriptional regulator [Bacillus thuringiensis serovar navarrensis]RFB09354.1 ArsR family transcriptional regulator [Bacillus sp. OE]
MLNYEKNAEVLKALAHPVRIKILKELITRGACNVNQIVDILGIPQSTVSQHLSKMKSQKLIMSDRKGLEVYYSAQNKTINSIVEILLDLKILIVSKN